MKIISNNQDLSMMARNGCLKTFGEIFVIIMLNESTMVLTDLFSQNNLTRTRNGVTASVTMIDEFSEMVEMRYQNIRVPFMDEYKDRDGKACVLYPYAPDIVEPLEQLSEEELVFDTHDEFSEFIKKLEEYTKNFLAFANEETLSIMITDYELAINSNELFLYLDYEQVRLKYRKFK